MTNKDPNPQEEQSSPSLVKREFTNLSKVKKDFTADQKAFVVKTIAPTLNENELLLFLYRSSKLGLNPLEGEIFAYTSFETINGQKVRKMVMIVARDGKRKLAARTGHFKGIRTQAIYVKGVEQYNSATERTTVSIKQVQPWEGGKLWGAECTVNRNDCEIPFIVTVPLSEYTRKSKIWTYKPETMIKKVAESQCLSYAFPELAGVYDESERTDLTTAEKKLPTMSGGDKPATDEQKATIGVLGGEISDNLTKQDAAEMISQLSANGGKSAK